MSTPTVAVVGGSLTGPVTTLLLQKAGYNAHLYEAVPEAASLAGGVIGLGHPALAALDDLGIGQDEFVVNTSERVVAIKVRDNAETGKVTTLYPGRTTTWTMLNAACRARVQPGTWHGGKRVVGLHETDAAARLEFADGDTATADMIVFADGRKSTGRALLDPHRKLTYAGYVAHRGEFHGAHTDLSGGFTRFEPRGTQFNTFPTTAGGVDIDWTFYVDSPADQFRAHFGGDPTTKTFVFPRDISEDARQFVNDAALRLLPLTEAEMVIWTKKRMAAPVIDIEAPGRMVWPVGQSRAVLIGDALAPVRPHTARGANNGIEQAVDLVQSFRQHTRWSADLDSALAGWEERQLPTVQKSVALGPVFGEKLGLGMGNQPAPVPSR